MSNFDIKDSPQLLDRLIVINREHPLSSTVPFPSESAPGWQEVNLNSTGALTFVRRQPVTTAQAIGHITRLTPVLLNKQSGVTQRDGTWWPVVLESNSTKGWVRSDVVTIAPDADPVVVSLNAPYVSQLGTDASRIHNDCPEAASLMMIHYDHLMSGRRIMKGLTVNMLVARFGATRSDDVQPLTFITTLLDDFGLDAEIVTDLTVDNIISLIDHKQLCIALVNYEHLRPGNKRFGHFVCPNGFGQHGLYIHDPYTLGRDAYVTIEDMNKALTDISGIAARPYQGVILS